MKHTTKHCEEIAKMTPEEKVFAARYGSALHAVLAKGQQDKETQVAPELNLKQVSASGAATTLPTDTKLPVVTKPTDTKTVDATKEATMTPVDPPPKNDRDTEAGEKPAKLPRKEGDDASMDDELG